MQKNQLYYGDNLTVLRDHIQDESVDLIYLDPPFNSRADYNVLFAEKDGTRSSSQITAFEDTWEWNIDAEHAYQSVVEGGGRVAEAISHDAQMGSSVFHLQISCLIFVEKI
jgi:site-specific DNA-methyltransferase (adenine-specific)